MHFNKAGVFAVVALSSTVLAQWDDSYDYSLHARDAEAEYNSYLDDLVFELSRRAPSQQKQSSDSDKLAEAKAANKKVNADLKDMAALKGKQQEHSKQIAKLNKDIAKVKADMKPFHDKLKGLQAQKTKLEGLKKQEQKQWNADSADMKKQQATVQKDLARRGDYDNEEGLLF